MKEKIITIEYEGQQFEGNTQDILLEQLESQGIHIPYSCRSGICGSCQLKLCRGKVKPLVKNAYTKEGYILACSCVPESHIILSHIT